MTPPSRVARKTRSPLSCLECGTLLCVVIIFTLPLCFPVSPASAVPDTLGHGSGTQVLSGSQTIAVTWAIGSSVSNLSDQLLHTAPSAPHLCYGTRQHPLILFRSVCRVAATPSWSYFGFRGCLLCVPPVCMLHIPLWQAQSRLPIPFSPPRHRSFHLAPAWHPP